jgi:transcriptional regulator with XRE-family HTH domain
METTEVPGSRGALRVQVAEEVRALMGRRRVTGAELARAIDVPQASLQRRLSGRYPFDVDLLAQVADYFGVPVVSLFPKAGEGHMTGYFPTFADDPDATGVAA